MPVYIDDYMCVFVPVYIDVYECVCAAQAVP